MSHARKANPKVDLGPDHLLMIVGGIINREFYVGRDPQGWLITSWRKEAAKKLKGPGLASAERALKRRGYIVERVRVE